MLLSKLAPSPTNASLSHGVPSAAELVPLVMMCANQRYCCFELLNIFLQSLVIFAVIKTLVGETSGGACFGAAGEHPARRRTVANGVFVAAVEQRRAGQSQRHARFVGTGTHCTRLSRAHASHC